MRFAFGRRGSRSKADAVGARQGARGGAGTGGELATLNGDPQLHESRNLLN
jgi:hypothetical protein